MAKNSISQGPLKTDFGVNNGPILALTVSKEAYWIGLRHFVRFFIKMMGFQGAMSRWKSVYFSVMKYFEFIILTRSVSPRDHCGMHAHS